MSHLMSKEMRNFKRDTGHMKKNQMEMLELKNTVLIVKTSRKLSNRITKNCLKNQKFNRFNQTAMTSETVSDMFLRVLVRKKRQINMQKILAEIFKIGSKMVTHCYKKSSEKPVLPF